MENEDYSLAIPVLNSILEYEPQSVPKDQLRHVSDAMRNLETAYREVDRHTEAHMMMKKQNELDMHIQDDRR